LAGSAGGRWGFSSFLERLLFRVIDRILALHRKHFLA
jgi:hypothetical protein